MSQIKIDLDVVEELNRNVDQYVHKLSNVNSNVSSLTYHVDSAITARRNIRTRLQSTSQSLRNLETRLEELNLFIKNSIDRYSRTETDLSRKALSIDDRKNGAYSGIENIKGPELLAYEPSKTVTLEELFTHKSDRYTIEQLNEIWNQLSDDDRKTISKQFSENWFKQVLKDIGNDIAYAAETSRDSFGGIGNDFLNGLQTRADKALDSPCDFINWLTIGASGGIYEGAKHRADHMLDSTYDFFNWLTVGAVETVDEAFTPDKPLSKEHWLASLGVVSFIFGGAKGQLGTKVGNGLDVDASRGAKTEVTLVEGTGEGGKETGRSKGLADFTGIGKTGEGIPIEKVNPKVLAEIYPEQSGAYGYLPKEGTAYANIDFTDVEKARANQLIRKEYLEQTKEIELTVDSMKSQGASSKEISIVVVDMRNQDKIVARATMTPEEVVELEKRNIKNYGNPIGPDAEWLFQKNKTKLERMNPNVSNEEVWESVLKASMRKDEVINTLLGIDN